MSQLNMKRWIVVCGVITLTACGKKDDDTSGDNMTLKGDNTSSTSLTQSYDLASSSDTGVAKIKVYKFAVSKSENCTDLVTVFTSTDGKIVDMNQAPTIGSGALADGTYKCIAMEMSDNITFTSKDTVGTKCVKDAENTMDVCRSGTTSKLIDGTAVSCDSKDNKVVVYISSLSTSENGADGHNAFLPPTSSSEAATRGLKLNSSLVISGSVTGAFVMDTRGKVVEETDGNGTAICGMQPPKFSFKKL